MGGSNQAYGGTDVMNDRNYLYQLMQRSPHDPLRAVAEQRLVDLNHRDALAQQAQEFGFRQAATARDEEARRQARSDALNETEAGRTERSQVRAQLTQQAEHDRKTQGLVAAMNSLTYDQTPEGKAALANVRNEYLKEMGIGGGTATGATPVKATTGLYGPGGADVKATTVANSPVDQAKAAFATPVANTTTAPVADTASPDVIPQHGWLQAAPRTANPDGSVTIHTPSGGQIITSSPNFPAPMNVPTKENMVANPITPPYALPTAAPADIASTVPVGFNPVALPNPAPTPAGSPVPSMFDMVKNAPIVAPAPTPGMPPPVPMPIPPMTDEQRKLLAQQQSGDQ